MTSTISVVIPVLNEESEIGTILSAARQRLDARGADWEIIVVDNASTDGTCAILEQVADGREGLRLLRNEVNRGKGYSIRRACWRRRTRSASCATLTVSLHCPRSRTWRRHCGGADIVVGSRVVKGAHVSRQQPIRRRIVGFGFLMLTRLLLGRLARDVYCGFKLWTDEAAVNVFSQVHLDGWVFDAEALALGKRLGFGTAEVGIDWTDRPNSRLSIRNVLLPAVTELNAARRNVARGEYGGGTSLSDPFRPAPTSSPSPD